MCDNIILDNDSDNGISLKDKKYTISVPEYDSNDAINRYEHRVAISGALEDVLECSVRSFSYTKI